MDTLRVAALQMPHGATLDANLATARAMIGAAADAGAQLALLPEYFFATFARPPTTEASAEVRAFFRAESRGVVLAGNVIEPPHNVGVVYAEGAPRLEQRKVHPMPREAAAGVEGGTSLRAADVAGRRLGVLVCADILYPEASRVLSLQGAQLLLNPVMSPWREEDDGREARVAVYVARAYDAGAFVVKAAGFRPPSREGPVIAGRSLVTAPWGVLARAKDEFAQELLLADLDFERLRAFGERQKAFPPRRPEAYKDLL